MNFCICYKSNTQFERTDTSEGADINKTGVSRYFMTWICWCFKGIAYKYEPNVCNSCHNITMMADELKNITILNLKGVDCICITEYTINDAFKMLDNS